MVSLLYISEPDSFWRCLYFLLSKGKLSLKPCTPDLTYQTALKWLFTYQNQSTGSKVADVLGLAYKEEKVPNSKIS